MSRLVRCVTLGALTLAARGDLGAQDSTVRAAAARWNYLLRQAGASEQGEPVVRVWLERSIFSAGEPVRVSYRVDQDAFVVVAQVDNQGNLSVLHPRSVGRSTFVRGGQDQLIRSARLGTRGTFVADARFGASGFVFAIASGAPLDLTSLTSRDFSAWVTGVPRGQPVARYIGDPYRVVQRFARVVLSDPDDWDFDIAFYSVDRPIYSTVNAFSYGTGCLDQIDAYDSWLTRPMGGAYYDQLGYGDEFGFRSACSRYRYLSCFMPLYGYGYGIPIFCDPYRRSQVAQTPTTPPLGPNGEDSTRVNPWVPDSVQRPNIEKGTPGPAGPPQTMALDPRRPLPTRSLRNDSEDLSFSIPARALRGRRTRDAGEDLTRAPRNQSGDGLIPMPGRPVPTMAGGQPIEWVRPPRAVERSEGFDRLPNRASLDRGRDRDRSSGGASTWNPPPRSNSPTFDREPIRSPGFSNPAGRSYDPPSFTPPPRPMTSGVDSRPMSMPAATSSPPPPPPQPAASTGGAKSADPPERKPPSGDKSP
ncbi:MAG: DUF4384 domain-containing protein [Gemmatimonadaceae bacterium]|nr:DUF4384 domain-containing protein [Gemmatimonadaceae bacterium]